MNAIIEKVLPQVKEIAVVGLSSNKARDAYHVSEFLVQQGKKVYPINPEDFEFCGQKSFKSLIEIPEEIQKNLDTVVVFRRSEFVPSIVDEILKMKFKPKFLWLQEGVIHANATNIAKENGLECVVNRCILKEIMAREINKE